MIPNSARTKGHRRPSYLRYEGDENLGCGKRDRPNQRVDIKSVSECPLSDRLLCPGRLRCPLTYSRRCLVKRMFRRTRWPPIEQPISKLLEGTTAAPMASELASHREVEA